MALSGSLNSNNSGLDGSSHITVSWSATQNYSANTSTISATMTLVLKSGTSLAATESGNITIDGNVFSFSHGSTSRGPGGSYTITTASQTITHNTDGTRSFTLSGSFTSGFTSFGTVSGSQSFTLDTIPRYADITSFTVTALTDESFTLNAVTDQSASTINFSIDGGTTYAGGGSGTSASQTYHGLASNTTFSVYAHSVNAASGLDAYSSQLTPTTNGQAGYFNPNGF